MSIEHTGDEIEPNNNNNKVNFIVLVSHGAFTLFCSSNTYKKSC